MSRPALTGTAVSAAVLLGALVLPTSGWTAPTTAQMVGQRMVVAF